MNIDHENLYATEAAKKGANPDILISCSICTRTFSTVRRRGRKKHTCSGTCTKIERILNRRKKRLVFRDGKSPVCIGCGAELPPPGRSGGRPLKRCPECHRRNQRLIEKKKRLKKRLKLKEFQLTA